MNQQDPAVSFGSSENARDPGSTNLHADSLASCAQHVPRRRPRSRGASLDVTQVSELLGCSTAHVYDLCERGELPHHRDLQNAIRFDCQVLGRALDLTTEGPTGGNPQDN
jgi:excisionase family DNA binding protein